jgi:tRNA(Ser,Leu) C12 N-acetylase TAN1
MQVQDHTVDIGKRVFCCNVNIDSNGLTITNLVEVLKDARELPVTTYFKNRVIAELNKEFEEEIEAEKLDDFEQELDYRETYGEKGKSKF